MSGAEDIKTLSAIRAYMLGHGTELFNAIFPDGLTTLRQ